MNFILSLWLSLAAHAFTPGALCTPTSAGFEGYKTPAHVAMCRRHVTAKQRNQVFRTYGIPEAQRSSYELDHRIPLCLGGSNANENLWPELWSDALAKDVLEKQLCTALRAGRITQAAAVSRMLAWKT